MDLRKIIPVAAMVALMPWGCSAKLPVMPFGVPGVDRTPALLQEATHQDWMSDRIVSRRISDGRTAFRAAQVPPPASEPDRALAAFPTAQANWPRALGSGGDYVSNSPAATFYGGTVPASLTNQVFFLSHNGRFYKVDKTTGAQAALPLGDIFTRTYVTLSPSCTRAYCYADSGRLYVINTLTMAQVAGSPISVNGGAGGRGIAPAYDPYTSRRDDAYEDLYVPDNSGWVSRYSVTATPAFSITLVNKFDLATGATAIPKIEAPALVLNGVIYQGDGDGAVDVVDVNDSANNVSYGVGDTPIHTAPAIELYDSGLYPTPPWTAPADGVPCFLFVNVGRSCAWVNLADDSVNYSQDLYVDDNDNQGFGKLLDYGYAVRNKRVTLTAVDGGSIATSGANLPGVAPANMRDRAKICPASDDAVNGSRQAVVSYLRFSDATALTANSQVVAATLSLKASATQSAPVPKVVDTSAYYQGDESKPLWSAATYTNTAGALQRPPLGTATTRYTGGGLRFGRVNFRNGRRYTWDVRAAFAGFNSSTTSGPAWQHALALSMPTAGTYYPGGIGPGFFQTTAAQFYNSTATNANDRPTLQITYAQVTHDPTSIQLYAPPVVDPIHRKVYVLNGNQVYGITYDYLNPDVTWGDTDYDPALNPGGTSYTTFCRTYYGTLGGGINGGGTWSGQNRFICNTVAPLVNFNATALYALNSYPTIGGGLVTGWKTAISKLTLPLDGTNRLVAGSPTFGTLTTFPQPAWMLNVNTLPTVGSYYMAMDPGNADVTTGAGIFFGLTNGSIYRYQP